MGRGRYALRIYVYRGGKNIENIGKRVSKGGVRLIVVRVMVFIIVCIVGSI